MKSKALIFCLSTIVTIGVFTACKKTTDVAPAPEPPKPELSSKDPQALSASLKVYHGQHTAGNLPAPSGSNLQLNEGEAYTHGFKGGLAIINPNISSGSVIAGYYMQVQGATEYIKIDYSKPRGARVGNTAKHSNPFSRGTHADSLSDGNVDSSLIIILPLNLKVPDTICVSYCAYDLQGNVSNVVNTCIIVNNLGPDAAGAWVNGDWKFTASWNGSEPHDTILYNRWFAFGSDYYCYYDSLQERSYLTSNNNGTIPVVSDTIFIRKTLVSFSNNGAMITDFDYTDKSVDYYNKPCDSITFWPMEVYKEKQSYAWSYNSATKKMILVYDYGQNGENDFSAWEYTVTKLNDNHFILIEDDTYDPGYAYHIRLEK